MIVKVLILMFVASCYGQRISIGPCPSVTPMEKFEPIKFLGKWNVLEQYPSLFEGNSRCNKQTFIIASNRIAILFKYITNNAPMKYFCDGTTNGDAGVPSWDLAINTIAVNMNYKILATDYMNYAVAYSCNNLALGLSHIENAWILTRKIPSQVFVNSTTIGREKLAAFNIATDPLKKIEHNCPF